jgi:hypothetical protein
MNNLMPANISTRPAAGVLYLAKPVDYLDLKKVLERVPGA